MLRRFGVAGEYGPKGIAGLMGAAAHLGMQAKAVLVATAHGGR